MTSKFCFVSQNIFLKVLPETGKRILTFPKLLFRSVEKLLFRKILFKTIKMCSTKKYFLKYNMVRIEMVLELGLEKEPLCMGARTTYTTLNRNEQPET